MMTDSMKLELRNIAKNFGYQSILRDINLTIEKGSVVGISGANGSGKSTLMKIISGYLSPSEGSITYHRHAQFISRDEVFQYLAYAAPYTSSPSLFTLKETFEHHTFFKPFTKKIDYKTYLDIIHLADPKSKYLRDFSSGMKQKVHLSLALLSATDLLLLDEPTSYLDKTARQWYADLLDENLANRTVIIASNDEEDFVRCKQQMFYIEEGRMR